MSLNKSLSNDVKEEGLPRIYEPFLVQFLAWVYMKIPWQKMRTQKNPHDIFNHRVRASARRGTLYEFASKLCNYFGLQTLPAEAQEALDTLRPFEADVLKVLNTEHIPFCVRAIMEAKRIKKCLEEERRKKK